MKNILNVFFLVFVCLMFVTTSCNKEKSNSGYDLDMNISTLKEDITLDCDGRFEKVITKRLIKLDDCRFIISGTIEYYLNGE